MKGAGGVWDGGHNPLGLTPLEIATGILIGPSPGSLPPAPAVAEDPLTVLRERAVELLQQRPCVVAFSGGRDSSALLAVMADTARREGLTPPTAVSLRWSDNPATDERVWQEQVADHVGVESWEVLEPGDDVDLLGEQAQDALVRCGLLWPASSTALVPLYRRAAGGVVVTGEGGDELFGTWPLARLRARVARRQRPVRPDVIDVGTTLLPAPLRVRRLRRHQHPYQRWLTAEATAAHRQSLSEDAAEDFRPWGAFVRSTAARRSARLARRSAEVLAAASGASYAAPLLEDRFVAALGQVAPVAGIGDRSQIMHHLFGHLLDERVLTRVSKATFGGVYWGPAARSFAESWDGTGLPEGLVTPGPLRAAWLSERPTFGSALPLHAAWLASRQPAAAGGVRATP